MRDTAGPDLTIIACGVGAQGGTMQAAIGDADDAMQYALGDRG
ncbi:hypothetical protein [Cohnella massiliensis]|nr:hypothetical protein [Cohnella massiliensis]